MKCAHRQKYQLVPHELVVVMTEKRYKQLENFFLPFLKPHVLLCIMLLEAISVRPKHTSTILREQLKED